MQSVTIKTLAPVYVVSRCPVGMGLPRPFPSRPSAWKRPASSSRCGPNSGSEAGLLLSAADGGGIEIDTRRYSAHADTLEGG